MFRCQCLVASIDFHCIQVAAKIIPSKKLHFLEHDLKFLYEIFANIWMFEFG